MMSKTDGDEAPGRALVEAFGTLEIFEAFLLHLDLRDILRVQTVSHHFHDTITRSPALQQMLFFPLIEDAGHQSKLNPLLADLFPPLFTLNKPPCPTGLIHIDDKDIFDWLSDPLRRESILRRDASWRRMFPVQPPAKLNTIKVISYDTCIHSSGSGFRARIGGQHQHLQDPGIKMGLLFDLMAQLDSLHPDSSFFVHWQMFPLGDGTDEWQQHDDQWDPDFFTWHDSEYLPLLSNHQEQELSNTIALYHNHDSWCGIGERPPSGLRVDTSFLSKVEESPESMLEYLDSPGTYAVCWIDYGTVTKQAPKEDQEERKSR